MRIFSSCCITIASCLLSAPPTSRCSLRMSLADDEDVGASTFWRRALNALPEDPASCMLQMRLSVQHAVEDPDSRKLAINIQVPALDAASRGFDARILARHIVAVAQECAQAAGSTPLLLVHSLPAALEATKELRGSLHGEGLGSSASEVVSLGSMLDDAATTELAAQVATRPAVIVGPFGDDEEHALSRLARADSPLVVLLNYWPVANDAERSSSRLPLARLAIRALESVRRPSPFPPLPEGFEVAFELLPLVLQPVRREQQPAAAAPSGFMPKAVLCRRYPQSWTLVVDADGAGYAEVSAFERRPRLGTLLDAVRRHVRGVRGQQAQDAAGGPRVGGGTQFDEARPTRAGQMLVSSGRDFEGRDSEVRSYDEEQAASPLSSRPTGAHAAPRLPAGLVAMRWVDIESSSDLDALVDGSSASTTPCLTPSHLV